jgi:SAM-dependent methyltransferase
MNALLCRACAAGLHETFADLGASPLANSYVDPLDVLAPEPFYALHAYVCSQCRLVQVPLVEAPEAIFNQTYAYFSSFSQSVLSHSRGYASAVVERFGLGPGHRVVEAASNDGYLLRFFRDLGIPVLGIEPSGSVARVAEAAGVPTRVTFFGEATARALVAEGLGADLFVGNNVLAHVPDVNDFVRGAKTLLNEGGVITMEFQYLLPMIENLYYDMIYHEHFSYFSLLSVEPILRRQGLRIFDVEEIAPQGGSLRIYACHDHEPSLPTTHRVAQQRGRERAAGLESPERYRAFGEQVKRTKRDLLRFLIEAREAGRTVVGYGAPAKGNTLLNYCGVKTDLLAYTVDVNPHKQGKLLPGTRIPILDPAAIMETRPDYVLILAWNIMDEIVAQMAGIRAWGGRFVVPLPSVAVIEHVPGEPLSVVEFAAAQRGQQFAAESARATTGEAAADPAEPRRA